MTLQQQCIAAAKAKGDALFEGDCIEILRSVFRGRLEVMNPKTIFQKVRDLMSVLLDHPDDDACWDVVSRYVNEGVADEHRKYLNQL